MVPHPWQTALTLTALASSRAHDPVAALVNLGVRVPALREAWSIMNRDGDSDSLQTASRALALRVGKFRSFRCCFHLLKPPRPGHVQ
jgi:hypothetical protein